MRKDRSRLSREEWQAVLGRFRQSGLGATAFCRSEGLVLTTFHKWKQRLGTGEVLGRFVEVKPREAAAPTWSMELELPHGVVLRFRG
jgi:hypothetical protein